MGSHMRIGLFGGTFNPVHLGHLRSAEEVRESFQLQQVFFIPSANPPHKEGKDIISSIHRIEMVRLAVEECPGFSVSDIEMERPGKSYSIETIDHFNELYGPGSMLFFIMGMDAFADIVTWKDYRGLFSRCNFVITTRPGYAIMDLKTILSPDLVSEFSLVPEENRFVHISKFSVYFREVTSLTISSSCIRERVKENTSVRFLAPDKIIEYIKTQGLYKES